MYMEIDTIRYTCMHCGRTETTILNSLSTSSRTCCLELYVEVNSARGVAYTCMYRGWLFNLCLTFSKRDMFRVPYVHAMIKTMTIL